MDPVERLCALLRESSGYALFRNADVKANLARGGDVDLLVEKPNAFSQRILDALGPPLMSMKRSYVHGFFWRWGHVDLVTTFEWRGAVYLPAEEVLGSAFRNRKGFLEASMPHQAVLCWFSSLIFGGFFKERYRDLIIQAAREHGEKLYHLLEYAAGPFWAQRLVEAAQDGRPEASVAWVRRLRWTLRWRAFLRSPYNTLKDWVRFWVAEVRLRIRPPAPWMAVLGPDGSGKSTLLSALREELGRGKPFVDVRAEHWRPGLILRHKSPGPVIDPHGKPPQGMLSSIAKLVFLVADWVVGYWLHLVNLRAKGMLLAFDRHYIDIVIDPKRYRYGAPLWMARLVGRLIPEPDLWLILDVPEEEILRRKREVPLEEIRRQREAYRRLASELPNAYLLDGSLSPEEVARQARDVILDILHERYVARRPTWFSHARRRDDLGWLKQSLGASENPEEQEARYLHLALPDGRGYLLPQNSRRAALAGLSLYPAQKPRARIAKSLLSLGLRSGLGTWILPKAAVDLEPLREFLTEVFGRKDLSLSVSLGAPGPHRKPVIQVASEGGEVLGYAKVGWNEATRGLVNNEATMIRKIQQLGLAQLRVPEIVWLQRDGSKALLVTEPIHGVGLTHSKNTLYPAVFETLTELAIKTRQDMLFGQSSFWRDLNERMAKVIRHVPGYQEAVLVRALDLIEDRLGERIVPFVFRMGDFTRWNLAMDAHANLLQLIDFEYARESWLVGSDAFHFIRSEGIINSETPNAFLCSLGISLEDSAVLYLAYLADIFAEWYMTWLAVQKRPHASAQKELKCLLNSMLRIVVQLESKK